MTPSETDTLRIITQLEEYHGRALPAEARLYYVESLASYLPTLLQDGARRWKEQNSPSTRFPSLAQIRACIDEIRVHTWQRTKQRENPKPISQPTITPYCDDPDYYRARWDLVARAARMTKAQLAQGFDELHQHYPGHEWDGAAAKLKTKFRAVNPNRELAPGDEGRRT